MDNIDGSVANINALLEELVTFTDQLNSREGTLGRILYDDAIYQRLERVLANAEDITSKIKPIVGDFRLPVAIARPKVHHAERGPGCSSAMLLPCPLAGGSRMIEGGPPACLPTPQCSLSAGRRRRSSRLASAIKVTSRTP